MRSHEEDKFEEDKFWATQTSADIGTPVTLASSKKNTALCRGSALTGAINSCIISDKSTDVQHTVAVVYEPGFDRRHTVQRLDKQTRQRQNNFKYTNRPERELLFYTW